MSTSYTEWASVFTSGDFCAVEKVLEDRAEGPVVGDVSDETSDELRKQQFHEAIQNIYRNDENVIASKETEQTMVKDVLQS